MCQYGLLPMVLKYRLIWIFLISVFMGQILIANENVERLAVENKLRVYLQSIDQKDVNDISEHFYFDRRGWDRGPVFCFGEGTTREFNDKNELKSFFNKWAKKQSTPYNTHIEALQITLLFDGKENRLYNADAVTKRVDASGKVLKGQRNLYYFQSDKLLGQDNSWTDWKIYMISNIEI